MKAIQKIFIAISFLGVSLLFMFSTSNACTMCMVSIDNKVLAGNNEDWSDENTYMRFIPAQDGEFGRVYVGFKDAYIQGGLNDQGLCFDGFATPPLEVIESTNKPHYQGHMLDAVMAECATVDEAMTFFKQYNLEYLKNAQLFYVDKTGNSAIIEGDEIIYKETNYQVCTNFYHSKKSQGGWPCWRYGLATEMLMSTNNHSIDLIRSILDATHQEGAYPTQYSNIFDLERGVMYLYYFHNFEEFITVDLAKELKNGSRNYFIPSLFAKIKTSSPSDGQKLSSRSVEFKWDGEADSYQLLYSTNPDLNDAVSVTVNTSHSSMSGMGNIGVITILLFLAAGLISTRIKSFRIFLIFAAFFLIFSCNGDKSVSPAGPNYASYKLENLQANTEYYWKIETQPTEHFKSESVIKSFTTGD